MGNSTSYTPDPHAVSKAEVKSYYAGLHSQPTLLYRSKEQWSPPRGPEAQRRLKELREVFAHPIAKVWNHDLGWKLSRLWMLTQLVNIHHIAEFVNWDS